MVSSDHRLFDRQRSVHEMLGGDLVADIILWRQKNLTLWILWITLASWIVFKRWSYTLLSLVSSVLLLLLSILFLWAKSAALINRCAPPLPQLYLSEEMVNGVAAIIRVRVNSLLSVSQDIAQAKDTKLFFKVAACLLLMCIIGSLTDVLNFGCTSLLITFTVPTLYEKYEDHIDGYLIMGYHKLQILYIKFDVQCLGAVRRWVLEKQKLS